MITWNLGFRVGFPTGNGFPDWVDGFPVEALSRFLTSVVVGFPTEWPNVSGLGRQNVSGLGCQNVSRLGSQNVSRLTGQMFPDCVVKMFPDWVVRMFPDWVARMFPDWVAMFPDWGTNVSRLGILPKMIERQYLF